MALAFSKVSITEAGQPALFNLCLSISKLLNEAWLDPHRLLDPVEEGLAHSEVKLGVPAQETAAMLITACEAKGNDSYH